MSTVKSLEDLKKMRDEAIAKRNLKTAEGHVHVIVGMGTCGIAAGARDTMKSVLDVIEKDNLTDIVVTQTGCIGLCEKEPIIQVAVGDQPKVTYGKVTPDVARLIMKEHVVGGSIVKTHEIQL
jgi:NADP-reducing hydrogenase subunit HndB